MELKTSAPRAGAVFITVLVMTLLFVHPTPVKSDWGRNSGPFADGIATCQFTNVVNDSLGLNSTIWLNYQINDSRIWEANGTLTWAFDPNFAFWAYFWADFARIMTSIGIDAPLDRVLWSLPVKHPNEPISDYPLGWVIDFNNGTYSHDDTFAKHYPAEDEAIFCGIGVSNYTIVYLGALVHPSERAPLHPREQWAAKASWPIGEGPGVGSEAEWNETAHLLSARLNDTWYIESCTFGKSYNAGSDNVAWPIQMTLFGLLILVGLGSKRWQRPSTDRLKRKDKDHC